METFYQILGVIAASLIVWYLYRTVKNRPELFSRENMNKSMGTMGVLALILIAFVGFLILMLKYS
ncbi:hypothetical protein Lbir_2232 [Legionella birminghamensis]|uniref:Uncharacterized protein n=1 Tax=Legionella birminghamensis TaxID=28083 RepID=A0A378I6E8_9GAMM|nr:hypothetical protein [Legionella birminghamensis]KTC68699.1 hypothetical protein Lbir_2232 [Legionella birminghamensis]STX30315.1 Uncharacterised protein [Legionella birminghamensis]